MRKSTFYGFAAICGVGSFFFAFVVWLAFFDTGGGSPKSMRVEQDFVSMGSAIKMYCINAGRPPTTAEGLEALVTGPKTTPKPKRWIQIMRKVPMDPWGTPYRYALLAPKEREWRWELRSPGQDGVFGNGDDMATEDEYGGTFDSSAMQAGATSGSHPSY